MGLQKPNNNFDFKNGGPGTWELATRMNIERVSNKRLQSGTVALNWYINPHVRFMANYAHVFTNKTIYSGFTKVMPALATSGQHPNIFMARAQVDF